MNILAALNLALATLFYIFSWKQVAPVGMSFTGGVVLSIFSACSYKIEKRSQIILVSTGVMIAMLIVVQSFIPGDVSIFIFKSEFVKRCFAYTVITFVVILGSVFVFYEKDKKFCIFLFKIMLFLGTILNALPLLSYLSK
jgi:hypothetical protein